jgi:ATP-dependent Clp protease ATP-binding subunit ClpC
MFERYTEPARRAIFYAKTFSIAASAPAMDSTHLLHGLMSPHKPRAEKMFHLREKVPQYCASPGNSAIKASFQTLSLPLTDEVKRILYYAAREADGMGDAWVDTDHLLLGILSESGSSATQQLAAAGISLENGRKVVMENRSSRPNYGPVIPPGKIPSPRVWLMSKWCWWKARRSEKRFAVKRPK